MEFQQQDQRFRFLQRHYSPSQGWVTRRYARKKNAFERSFTSPTSRVFRRPSLVTSGMSRTNLRNRNAINISMRHMTAERVQGSVGSRTNQIVNYFNPSQASQILLCLYSSSRQSWKNLTRTQRNHERPVSIG